MHLVAHLREKADGREVSPWVKSSGIENLMFLNRSRRKIRMPWVRACATVVLGWKCKVWESRKREKQGLVMENERERERENNAQIYKHLIEWLRKGIKWLECLFSFHDLCLCFCFIVVGTMAILKNFQNTLLDCCKSQRVFPSLYLLLFSPLNEFPSLIRFTSVRLFFSC